MMLFVRLSYVDTTFFEMDYGRFEQDQLLERPGSKARMGSPELTDCSGFGLEVFRTWGFHG